MLRYIEMKEGTGDNGPAWIARVQTSRSGTTVYFNGKALKRSERSYYIDSETGEVYWISGLKKNGRDRHSCGRGIIFVQADVLGEYLAFLGWEKLPASCYQLVHDIVTTDIAYFTQQENSKLPDASESL